MSRYKNTKTYTKGDKFNKRYYRTTLYRQVVKKDTDMYFIAQQGDRCDNLAFQFYGDSGLWWFIAKVNHLKTNNIPAGTSLRIPKDAKTAEGF
jgi:nucleoid-associated protein YgaU